MTTEDQPIDEFIQRIDPAFKCTIGEVVNLMRSQLNGADQRVEEGKVVFSKAGVDLASVSANNGDFRVKVSDESALEDDKDVLGNVSTDGNEIQFEKLEDIRRCGLKELLKKLDE